MGLPASEPDEPSDIFSTDMARQIQYEQVQNQYQCVQVSKVNVCKVSEYARRQVANKQDDKQRGGHQSSWGEYTDEKKTFGVTKTCGATPKHHNVGKARCVRVQLRRLQSGQISPMTKSSRISHMFSNYWNSNTKLNHGQKTTKAKQCDNDSRATSRQ